MEGRARGLTRGTILVFAWGGDIAEASCQDSQSHCPHVCCMYSPFHRGCFFSHWWCLVKSANYQAPLCCHFLPLSTLSFCSCVGWDTYRLVSTYKRLLLLVASWWQCPPSTQEACMYVMFVSLGNTQTVFTLFVYFNCGWNIYFVASLVTSLGCPSLPCHICWEYKHVYQLLKLILCIPDGSSVCVTNVAFCCMQLLPSGLITCIEHSVHASQEMHWWPCRGPAT